MQRVCDVTKLSDESMRKRTDWLQGWDSNEWNEKAIKNVFQTGVYNWCSSKGFMSINI